MHTNMTEFTVPESASQGKTRGPGCDAFPNFSTKYRPSAIQLVNLSANTSVASISTGEDFTFYDVQLEDLGTLHQAGVEHRVELTESGVTQRIGKYLKANPEADGGVHAWLFLVGCVLFEALLWGFPMSYGIFALHYDDHFGFGTTRDEDMLAYHHYGTAMIGTFTIGFTYLMAPISLTILNLWPRLREVSKYIGLTIAVGALVVGSFATQTWHLVLTQGILYAIGGSLLYWPTTFYIGEWFHKRQVLASRISSAGSVASGFALPFLLSKLLDKYGWVVTLRAWAITLVLVCLPLIHFIKPLDRRAAQYRCFRPNFAFLWKPTYLILQAANIFQSLGFFLPIIYMPLFAAGLRLSPTMGTLLVALINASSVLGSIIFGLLCKHCHISSVILISTIGSVYIIVLIWGFADGLVRAISFSIAYGLVAGGFTAMWGGMMEEIVAVKGCENVSMGVLMSAFAAARGLGAVASGPISEKLMDMVFITTWGETHINSYTGQFGPIIIYTAASAAAAGVGWFVSRKMRKQPNPYDVESLARKTSSVGRRRASSSVQSRASSSRAGSDGHPHIYMMSGAVGEPSDPNRLAPPKALQRRRHIP